eukprot:jgi/Orpsp1_1/1179504/evm.model.c7180000069576.1
MNQNNGTDQILNNNESSNINQLNELSLSDIEIAGSSLLYCNDCKIIKNNYQLVEFSMMDGKIIKNNNDQLAEFKTMDGKIKKLKYRKLADCAYDQTFKLLFTWKNKVNGKSGKDRLKSLLNSIFFPDAGEHGFKIRRIEYKNNENTQFNEKFGSGMLKYDIPCKCYCWKFEKEYETKIFNIEMQTGYGAGFLGRMYDYGYSLRQINNFTPVIILAFLNYNYYNPNEILHNGEIIGSKHFYVNRKDEPVFEQNDSLNIYCFYMPYEKDNLINNKPIIFKNKEINKTGREWLKLLSMRHWATSCYDELDNKRYLFPTNTLNIDENVASAMEILERVSNEDLRRFIREEADYNDMLKTSEEKGRKEGEKRKAIEIAEKLINTDMDEVLISQTCGLDLEDVRNMKKKVKNK